MTTIEKNQCLEAKLKRIESTCQKVMERQSGTLETAISAKSDYARGLAEGHLMMAELVTVLCNE